MRNEELILSHLLYNETFSRKVLPYLKEEYFSEKSDKVLYQLIDYYTNKYNKLPSKEALLFDLNKVKLNERDHEKANEIIENLKIDTITDLDWLISHTETFCKEKAIYNAINDSLIIFAGKDDKKRTTAIIPELLNQAIGVTFDPTVGHDFLEDFEKRFEYYNKEEYKLPFELDTLNNITNGGISLGTLSAILGGIHVGKSLCMCSLAASHLSMGKNVLYITLEMSEEEISKRIDANLLDIPMDNIDLLKHEKYVNDINKLKFKIFGKLIVKQYPTASASVLHFKHLLHELKIKKKFIPDIIYIDYINLCVSSRIKMGSGAVNSYTYIKYIAEELRGLAIEENTRIFTATQLTRSGSVNSDVGMEDTAESFGLPAVLDFFLAVTQPEDLKALNQYLFKQLKNRFKDMNINNRFIIGVDKPKMRLYDVESSAQNGLVQPINNNLNLTDNEKFLNFT